ncbi:protein FAM204A isoform X3 [Python bivittatus]|uniref:Protein FAM204A isoform X3 n=1 Tax=Python bivittatus TaxID=176946 RepID=A0A9F5IDM0_PYTBI|nr:protein FAM204A isoform X3 [Python bivittatus]
MWSGLLPPGVNEADVAISSDDDETVSLPNLILNEKREEKEFLGKQTSDHEEKNIAENQLPSAEEQECLACPPGISLDMWNKFQNLQKKNLEMKNQEKCQTVKRRKRKHSRKGEMKKKNSEEITESQQSTKESHLKELTQYFGINDRFKPLASKETTPKTKQNARNKQTDNNEDETDMDEGEPKAVFGSYLTGNSYQFPDETTEAGPGIGKEEDIKKKCQGFT